MNRTAEPFTDNHSFICGRENPYGLHLTPVLNLAENLVSSNMVLKENGFLPTCPHLPDYAHPGIITSIVDEMVGRLAVLTVGRPAIVTATITLKVHQPVPLNQALTFRGSIVNRVDRKLYAQGSIFRDKDNALLVSSQALFIELTEQQVSGVKKNLKTQQARILAENEEEDNA